MPRHAALKMASGFVDSVVLVGAGEVRHQAQHGDGRAVVEPLDGFARHRRRDAEAVHSRVDLDEHFDRPLEARALEHPQLRLVVHDNREPALRDLGQLVRA